MVSPGPSRGFLLLLALALAPVLQAASPVLPGRVIDEAGAPVGGALVTLAAAGVEAPLRATTDEAGRFTLGPLPPARYRLEVERRGFYAFATELEISATPGPLEVVLKHIQESDETVSITYSAPPIDREEAVAATTLTSDEIVNLPFSATHDFRNALPLMPGVVKDNAGRIHVSGGGEDQVYYALDGFNLTSPVSNILENRISVDALRAVRVESSRYSAEHGKGSAGAMLLESQRGDDRLRFSATNFLPSYEIHDGLAISNWNPRATFSGPLRRGRAWYFNATDLQYDLNIVDLLPSDSNTNRNWTGSNLSRFQVNLTPRNVLTSSFLVNFRNSRHLGIGPLDPVETSQNRHERFYFVNLKDQIYLASGWVVEAGLALNQIRARARPLGDALYTITPEGRRGNYFLESSSKVQRFQGLANVMAPPRSWAGRHLLKFGLDADSIVYRQLSSRNPFEVRRSSGDPARFVSFSGNPRFGRDSFDLSGYGQDRWSPSERVLVEVGLRFDWDQILRRPALSPRLAATWSPPGTRDTKLSAGVGVFYDAVNLGLLTRCLDQTRYDTFYGEDGSVRGPVLSLYAADERILRPTRFVNWSVGFEQRIPGTVYVRGNFMRRTGRHGWSYEMFPAASSTLFELADLRQDRYSALELTATRTFRGGHPWLVSYTRSAARSSAVIDFSLENPIFARQSGGPLAWDSPNRLISWATLPVPRSSRYTLAYYLEWRSGFPYTVVDDHQRLVGAPNGSRFPDYFSVNLHLERRFKIGRAQWALRAGFNNLTGHSNPVSVINTIGSPDFERFSGGQGRVFTGRIRFLGRS